MSSRLAVWGLTAALVMGASLAPPSAPATAAVHPLPAVELSSPALTAGPAEQASHRFGFSGALFHQSVTAVQRSHGQRGCQQATTHAAPQSAAENACR